MTSIADLIRQSPVIYALLASLENLLLVAGCAFVSVALFHLRVRKRAWSFTLCAVLCVGCGVCAQLCPKKAFASSI